jgi:transmembrane sensor
MAQTNQRLQFLFERFIAGACTDGELKEFWQLLNESEDADPIKQQMEQLWHKEQPASANDWDVVYARIRTRAMALDSKAPRRISWVAAATVVIIVTGVAMYGWLRPAKPASPIVQTMVPTPDAAPGGNKATLTLADGSHIVLDEANNGTVARQGDASVVKTDSGQLVYQVAYNNATAITYNTLTTPRGGQFQLGLPDGSKVWLNAASSIRYPTAFAGKERRVEITGEAYFEVAKNAQKPFIVSINKETEIAVLGTHFNVNSYSDEASIKTTLLEGSVQVKYKNAGVVLKPGQQSVQTQKLTVNDNADIGQVMAWKDGIFNFHHATLRDVMRQLSRWYDIEVVYEDGVPDIEFGGRMGRDVSLAKLLYFFKGSDVHFRIENSGKKLIVTR